MTMCVTSPSCTMGPHMVRAAEEALSKIAGVKSARVEMDPELLLVAGEHDEQGAFQSCEAPPGVGSQAPGRSSAVAPVTPGR